MSEFNNAVQLARYILNDPRGRPDNDLALLLSRQLIEHVMRLERMKQNALIAAEVVARFVESDPHLWDRLSCQTCEDVSALLNRPFGCSVEGGEA